MSAGAEVSEEARLRRELDASAPGSGEAAALISDLATLKLSEGKVEEAHALFARLREERNDELEQLAQEAAQDPSQVPQPATANGVGLVGDEDDDWETSADRPIQQQQKRQPSTSAATASATSQQRKPNGHNASSSSAPAPVRALRAIARNDEWDTQQGSATPPRGSGTPLRGGSAGTSGTSSPYRGTSSHRTGNGGGAAGGIDESGPHPHVLEVYGLNRDVSTVHLEEWLNSLLGGPGNSGGGNANAPLRPVVRWVDDDHALLVCCNVGEARELLALSEGTSFSLRPFAQASEAARSTKAEYDLLPPKARPKTTTVVANKLLAHHLGMQGLRDKGKEQELRAARDAAKQHRKAKAEALEAAWGDDDDDE